MTLSYHSRDGLRYRSLGPDRKESGVLVSRRAPRLIRGIPILIAGMSAVVASTISAGACGVFSSIALNPTSGPPGAVVLVAGGGFAPPPGGSVDISLGTTGPILGSTNATSFSVPITIPSSTPPGVIVIAATDHTGSVDHVTATFTVTAPPPPAPGSSGSSGGPPPPPPPAATSGSAPGSGTPVSSSSGGPVTGVPSGSGGSNSVLPHGGPPSGAGSFAIQGFGGGDASAIPAGSSDTTGAINAAGAANPRLAWVGSVFGTPRDGFNAIAGSANALSRVTSTVPQVALVPVGILVATLLPVLLAAGTVLSVRRRKATRRT